MSDRERFEQLWSRLTRTQRHFIVALSDYPSKKEAAEAIGLRPSTVYHWGHEVDEAIALLAGDLMTGALDALRAAVAKAAVVKTEALELEDDRLRQQAATEILDRVLGKAHPRREEVEDGELEVRVHYVESERG